MALVESHPLITKDT